MKKDLVDSYKTFKRDENVFYVGKGHVLAYCQICNIIHSFTKQDYMLEKQILENKDTRVANSLTLSFPTTAPRESRPEPCLPGEGWGLEGAKPPAPAKVKNKNN